MEFGDLSEFLTASAYTTVVNALSPLCSGFCDVKAMKIFNDPSTFTATTSRLNETIPVPDFWATLLLSFPSISIRDADSVFESISGVVVYSSPNYFMSLDATNTLPPNDTSYQYQYSVKPTVTLPNAHINAEEAWDVVPSGGDSRVRVGIFDTGCDWSHLDFGYDGSVPGSTKVSGWNLGTQTYLIADSVGDPDGHGSAVAGIIGANRNNTTGIAGIAGGDLSTIPYHDGVRLFCYSDVETTDLAQITSAIIGASTPFNQMVYYNSHAINVMNNSWHIDSLHPFFTDTSVTLLTEAVHFANRHKVTFVAARGNAGVDNIQYPAVIDDDWVLNVGGIGSTGNYKSNLLNENWFGCSYGHNVDIAAPATYYSVYSTWKDNLYYNFSGTSAAAPHVTGVVGLLMTHMNKVGGADDPQNLAPEDCEFIIQNSASAMPNGATLPNDSVGSGRLNAGKALRMIEKPYRTLYHFNTNNQPNTVAKSVYSNNVTVKLTEWYQNLSATWFKPGKYVVKTFLITDNFNHSFTYPTDSLMYCWLRPSSSEVLELYDANMKIKPRQRVVLNSYSSSSAYMKGYIYQVSDTLGNALGWWPCDTSFIAIGTNPLFSYSMLTKNKAVGIHETKKDESGVSLFPNPASNKQTIKIETEKAADISIQLYDLMGRQLKIVYTGRTSIGENIYHNDINNLPNSMYIYVIKIDDKPISKRFIKE